MNNPNKLKAFLLRSRWKMWEYILVVTGWAFGYGSEVYYSVKASRNAAYFSYTLYS